jgi:hypothetical protein
MYLASRTHGLFRLSLHSTLDSYRLTAGGPGSVGQGAKRVGAVWRGWESDRVGGMRGGFSVGVVRDRGE